MITLLIILWSIFSDIDHIKIDCTQKGGIFIKDLFTIEKCIPLETNPACMIGMIHQVEFDSDLIYILDIRNNKILAFNHIGQFKFQVGKAGHGPGEFITPLCFDICKDQIVVFDNSGKIYHFTKDGKFIKSVRTEFLVVDAIKYFENHTFALVTAKTKPPYEIYLLDEKGKISGKFCQYNPEIDVSFAIDAFFKDDNGDLFCFPQFMDGIYKFVNNTFEKTYSVDYEPEINPVYANHTNFEKAETKIPIVANVLKSKDYLILLNAYKRRYAIFNLKNKLTKNGSL
jgi:hypothetical protein